MSSKKEILVLSLEQNVPGVTSVPGKVKEY